MGNNHDAEELSAFLDGESVDPEAVRRRLREEPVLAQEHAALMALSQHLQALPKHEPAAGFSARVVAQACEERDRRRRSWRPARCLALGTASLLLALAAASVFLPRSQPSGGDVETPIVSALPDEEALFKAIMAQLDAGDTLPTQWEPPFGDTNALQQEAVLTEDELLDALAVSDWFEPVETAFDGTLDLDALVDDLDETEAEVLTDLLLSYTEEGWMT